MQQNITVDRNLRSLVESKNDYLHLLAVQKLIEVYGFNVDKVTAQIELDFGGTRDTRFRDKMKRFFALLQAQSSVRDSGLNPLDLLRDAKTQAERV